MSTRNYPISDKWLHPDDPDDPTLPPYCDIYEIRNDPAGNVPQPGNVLHHAPDQPSSAYLDWVLANDPGVFKKLDGSNPSRIDHILAARFTDCGIHIGDTDNGNNVRGVMQDSAIITIGEFTGGVDHDEQYRRIYRHGTEVEKFWFLGY